MKISSRVCDVCVHCAKRDEAAKPCVDLGSYQRVAGCTGQVRFLCELHTRGMRAHEAFVPTSAADRAARLKLKRAFAAVRNGNASADDLALVAAAEA